MADAEKEAALTSVRNSIEDCEAELALLRRIETAMQSNDVNAAIDVYADALKLAARRNARNAAVVPAGPTQPKGEA